MAQKESLRTIFWHLFVLTSVVLLLPQSGWAGCARDLTIDKRYAQMMEENTDSNLAITGLLNETFSPLLKKISRQILRLKPESIRRSVGQYKNSISSHDFTDEQILVQENVVRSTMTFDGIYKGNFEIEGQDWTWRTPYTTFNQAEMQKLNLACLFVGKFISKMDLDHSTFYRNAGDLLNHITFDHAREPATFALGSCFT